MENDLLTELKSVVATMIGNGIEPSQKALDLIAEADGRAPMTYNFRVKITVDFEINASSEEEAIKKAGEYMEELTMIQCGEFIGYEEETPMMVGRQINFAA